MSVSSRLRREHGRVRIGLGLVLAMAGLLLLLSGVRLFGRYEMPVIHAAPGTPVPTGDSDIEGLLFGASPAIDSSWTEGNLCAGQRPDPGCYSDNENVPHRVLLSDLTVGAIYDVFVEHDFEDADGVVGYANFNGVAAISGASVVSLTNLDPAGNPDERRYRITFTATADEAEIRFNALLGPMAHDWSGSQLHARLSDGAESVPLPVNELVPLGPNLTLTKSDTPDPVVEGHNITYTVTVGNNGDVATSGEISVEDALPPGTTFVSASGTGWSCSEAAGLVTCTRPVAIAAGGTAPVITIVVTAPEDVCSPLTNHVQVSGGGDTGANPDGEASAVTAVAGCVGAIIIVKDTDPETSGLSFDFDGDLGDIDLEDDEQATFTSLAPGSYAVSENEAAGWSLTGISCSGTASDNIAVNIAAETVTIDLLAGETVTCTFNNQEQAAPTSTPVTPTNTPIPTNTPAPTSTPVTEALPLVVTATPQPVTEVLPSVLPGAGSGSDGDAWLLTISGVLLMLFGATLVAMRGAARNE